MSKAVRIVKTPDVLHGKPRIEGTRVGAFTVGELVRRQAWTVDDILEEFDIDAEQARVAVAYYDDHPELMETLRAQKAARKESLETDSQAE
jgi:uncharacterized protein (DUF433 family)